MNLRNRAILWLLVIGAPLLGLMFWRVGSARDNALEYWQARTEQVVKVKGAAVGLWWRERHGDAELLARGVALKEFVRAPAESAARAALVESLERTRSVFAYEWAAVFGAAGQLHAATAGATPPSDVVRAVVQRALATGTTLPGIDGTSPRNLAIVVAHPVGAGAERFAVVLSTRPQQTLFKLVTQETAGTRTGETVIGVQEGDQILCFTELKRADPDWFHRFPVQGSGDTPMQNALMGRGGFAEGLDYSGTRVLSATSFNHETGWGIVRKVDRAEAFAPVEQRLKTEGGLAAALWLGLSLALVAVGERKRTAGLRVELERHRLEAKARQLQSNAEASDRRAARLAHLLDQAGEQVDVFEAETLAHVLSNKATQEKLGYGEEELSRRTLTDLAPGLDAAELRHRITQLMTGSAESQTLNTEYQRRDGSRFPVCLRLSTISGEDPPVFLAVATDVSRERELETQLQHAQKLEAVARLAGGVAHDFNNVLTVISVSAELALAELPEGAPLRDDLLQIRGASERAARLTSQLLAFSRRQMIRPVVCQLNAIVSEMSEFLARLIGEHIELEVDLEPDLAAVLVDPSQVEQVLANLVVNARDAMPSGGRLTLETANVELGDEYVRSHHEVIAGPYVRITVTDSGEGMTEETRTRLFEPFFTTKEKGRGTGLGLATVYGIVRQSGGHIWVYSELGHGTTFKIYLPRAPDDAVSPAIVEHSPETERARAGETILLVEDEDDVRKLAARILAERGYEVLTAKDGQDALSVARGHAGPIHLLLTDVVMPRLSGKALAERLQTSRPAVRVLFMSGFTNNAIVHNNVLDPGTQFLAKPFTAHALARSVRAVIDAEAPA
ncbi:MAG: response regulator [Myxococcales bacterium]|nr:response regulator [Myxococcales bacterium]